MSEGQSNRSAASELFGDFQAREYLEILRRRRWWIILSTTALFCATVVVAIRLPNIYRSETVILVDAQKVPDTFVASTVSTSITDRLATIQQEVMSPTRLLQLINKMGLYPELKGKANDQAIVARMQKSISVEIVSQGGRQLSAFRIAYSSNYPVEAAAVANQLATMFIHENLKVREQQATGTTEFLQGELEKTKRELDAKDAELRKIKSEHVTDLPESKQFHIQTLESLRAQLQASQDRVNRDEQEKVYLQSSIIANPPTVDLDKETGASPYQSRAQRLETRLSELRSRYGPGHPDVRKAQAELEALRLNAAKEEQKAPSQEPAQLSQRAIRNPVLESQLQGVEDDIQKQIQLQAQLQEQIGFHTSALARGPIFEQQTAGLMRDYDSLRAHYTSLLDKELAAQMSSNLEDRQKGERFLVLDRAQIPEKPFGPNRMLIGLAGLLAGLLGGVGLAIVTEIADESVRDDREAARILGKPVLAGIPEILTKQQLRRKRCTAMVAVVGTALSSAAVGLVLSNISARLL